MVQLVACMIYTPPPTGCLLRIAGHAASCGYCGEVVYPQLEVLRAHDFNWNGSRVTWFSRDFGMWVHRCADRASRAEAVEIHNLSSVG